MKNNLYLELTDRSKQIFKTVVESYLETGFPSGSETVLKRAGLDISSASVRSILSNLQKEGLLFSPHTSAGRVPTDKGMRFFVDGLLEFGRISKSEKENIEQLSSSKSKSYQEVLDEASKAISGLSNYAGIVIAPKFQKNLKHLEFIRLNQTQIMSILAYENGEIENRIIEDGGKYTDTQLLQTSNYLSEKFKNKNINEIKKIIQDDVISSRSSLEDISKKLIKKGIAEIDPKLNNPYIFLHGQSKLLEDDIISKDLDQIRELFDEIEKKNNLCRYTRKRREGEGCANFYWFSKFFI